MLDSATRHLILKIYEGKQVSTLKGKGSLTKCGQFESTVKIGGNEVKVKTDTIIPVTSPLSDIDINQANQLGSILTEGECVSFRKFQHPTNKNVILFENKGDFEFGYELDTNECSINSTYELKNILEAYMFLTLNGFAISKNFDKLYG